MGTTIDLASLARCLLPWKSRQLDTEGDLHAVPQQTLQSQAMGPVKEMDSAICDLLGAGHGKSMYDIASGDRHYQFGCELLDEGGMGYATRVATSDSATNGLLDRSSQGKY
ncbi:hypothetical protein T440DRAFT_80632 [Plenodomus tracheiphilus IPT5]|uniref:Uncharacterized protein n=1 Tax=Plenodomus tracheiphilus IPT5 TaxID=1408161 RepID=A0A6A7B546_9PLEO|nr:hypothetical protein T440DRAFT_80632 [Plenodomus tracheiphilus IPT5]